MDRNPDPIYGDGYREVAKLFAGLEPPRIVELVSLGTF
jgi:hypothetical protein